MEIMDIYSEEGTKVIYRAKGGWDCDTEMANKILTKGHVYTVDWVDVGSWSSRVCLKEFPDKMFNTVMFEEL